jgi:AraC family transcriptional regulator
MVWAEAIGQAIAYIESHIADELSVGEIAKQVNLSPFYFQKGFSLLCGLTVMEYIRKRRLALAGSELVSSDAKVLDVALKYGYASQKLLPGFTGRRPPWRARTAQRSNPSLR